MSTVVTTVFKHICERSGVMFPLNSMKFHTASKMFPGMDMPGTALHTPYALHAESPQVNKERDGSGVKSSLLALSSLFSRCPLRKEWPHSPWGQRTVRPCHQVR